MKATATKKTQFVNPARGLRVDHAAATHAHHAASHAAPGDAAQDAGVDREAAQAESYRIIVR